MDKPITVVLAEDHSIVRQGIRLILEKDPTIQILGEASDGVQALALIKEFAPQVLVSDIAMPNLNGIELVQQINQLSIQTKVLFLSMQDKEEYIIEAMQQGVLGFLPKSTVGEELVTAIHQIAKGKEYFSESVYNTAFKAIRSLHQRVEIRLTPREKEVLQLLALGLSTKLIADRLVVSEYTISNHRANLLRKLAAQNVAELIRKASELNLLD
ncbi:response regulator transcription factor [Xanthocytophaga agilis]|uniref:Response regulator transcription factor n=1 Tax=Xanthocytophaga agilis TaxID=3048010 RepID=A0AAE3RCP0_9BACT|nr:response regulator transcription factor [Xanthocytophaga agilis]MDJ1505849.1 response regulator transcription factor [Xanthocytophaga agilis]